MTTSVALCKTRRIVGVVAALSCAWALATAPASAALLAYEGFDYPDSEANDPVLALNGGTGWSGSWSAFGATSTAVTYQPDSLSIPNNTVASVGGRAKVTNGGGQKALVRQFDGIDFNAEGNSLYVSFYITKDTEVSDSSGENLELNLMNSGNTSLRTRVGMTSDDHFFTINNTSSIPAAIDETYFVVFKMLSGAGANLDQQFVAIYGGLDSVPEDEPLTWSFTDTQDFNLEVDTVRLLAGGNASGSFDEIRIGTTWADVIPPASSAVPEPSALLLVGLGLAGALGVRSRRPQK